MSEDEGAEKKKDRMAVFTKSDHVILIWMLIISMQKKQKN